jgi:hypothetical protein
MVDLAWTWMIGTTCKVNSSNSSNVKFVMTWILLVWLALQAKWSGERFYQLWDLPPKNSFWLATMGWHPLMNFNYAPNAYTWNFKITHIPYLFLHYLTFFFFFFLSLYILLNIKILIMYIKKIVTPKKKKNLFFPFLVKCIKCLVLNKILFDLFVKFSNFNFCVEILI